jgi:hypothetical protein
MVSQRAVEEPAPPALEGNHRPSSCGVNQGLGARQAPRRDLGLQLSAVVGRARMTMAVLPARLHADIQYHADVLPGTQFPMPVSGPPHSGEQGKRRGRRSISLPQSHGC